MASATNHETEASVKVKLLEDFDVKTVFGVFIETLVHSLYILTNVWANGAERFRLPARLLIPNSERSRNFSDWTFNTAQ